MEIITIAILGIIYGILLFVISRDKDKEIRFILGHSKDSIDQIVKAIKSKDAQEFSDLRNETELPVQETRNYTPLDEVDPGKLLELIKNDNK